MFSLFPDLYQNVHWGLWIAAHIEASPCSRNVENRRGSPQLIVKFTVFPCMSVSECQGKCLWIQWVLIALSVLPESNSLKSRFQGFSLLRHEAGAEPDGESGAPSYSAVTSSSKASYPPNQCFHHIQTLQTLLSFESIAFQNASILFTVKQVKKCKENFGINLRQCFVPTFLFTQAGKFRFFQVNGWNIIASSGPTVSRCHHQSWILKLWRTPGAFHDCSSHDSVDLVCERENNNWWITSKYIKICR